MYYHYNVPSVVDSDPPTQSTKYYTETFRYISDSNQISNYHTEQTSVADPLQTFSCRASVFILLSDSWSLCNSFNCLCNPSALLEALSFSICANGKQPCCTREQIYNYIAARILEDFIIITCSNVSCRDAHEMMKGSQLASWYAK